MNCKPWSGLQFLGHRFQKKRCTIQHFKIQVIGNILIQGPYCFERPEIGAEDWQVPPGPSYPIAC